MPPEHPSAPPCPKCHTESAERLPFKQNGTPLPIYSCVECGHVWREPRRPPPPRPRDAGN